jgi:phospholipase/carboxylesterase
MNRLAAPFAPQETFSSATLDFTSSHSATSLSPPAPRGGRRRRRVHEAAPGVALFSPIHYERRYAYPLVIWLHGDGGSQRELRQVMPLVSVRNYVGAAVRGLPLPGCASGCAWRQTAESIDAAAEGVDRCIELAQQRFNVHPERIFLVGHGSGGTMALRLALQSPLALAGAASLNGPLPRGNCPLARVNAARRLPLLLMTCNDSRQYPAPRVAEDLRLLHAAGFSLALRHYLCGDELYTDMFVDMNQWLMARVCGTPAAAPA